MTNLTNEGITVNTNAVNVAVVDGKTVTESVELRTTQQGAPVRIKAVKDGKYILAEGGEKPVAPENLTIKRVGNDLHVATEGTSPDQPQLIIEGFFENPGQLVGVAEDGAYYEYISSDAESDHAAAFLIDGVSSPQVLSSEELTGFGNGLVAGSGIGWFWPALLGLGALGVLGAAYALTRDDDNNHHDAAVIPNTPSVGGASDSVGDVQGPIEKGGSSDDRTPTFSGGGTPGNTIIIEDNGNAIGEVVIGEDGKWEFTPTTPLPEGDHSIIVVEKDKDGNVSRPSDEFDFIVDTTAPGKSVINAIIDDVGDQQGIIASSGHTDDNTPTLSGTAEAGTKLEVFANGANIGETTVNTDGTWSFTPSPALADGEYSFTTVATDAAGNKGLPSDPYVITIDTVAPVKPGPGTGGIEEATDNVGPIQGNIENGGVTDDTTPTFGGSGLNPGDKVSIIDDGKVIGEVIVGAGGGWEFTPNPALSDGPHPITVVVTDPAGNQSEPSDPYIVIVDTTPPVKPGIGTGGIEEATDNVGPIQGNIENGGTTDDTTPTFGGSGLNPGDKVSIIDDGKVIGEVIVGAGGGWEFTPNPALSEGPHPITVVVTDPAGNESEPSDPYIVIVDTKPPVKPGVGTGGIEEALDNVGSIIGDIGNGGTTDDTTPTFSGSGLNPGDKVSIIDDGNLIGEVIVGAGGGWEFTPNPPLSEGPHPITVVVTDPAGNESEPSDPYLVIVDTTRPVKPGIGTGGIEEAIDNVGSIVGDIGNGGTTDDTTPTFGGSGLNPGDKVSIIDDGNLIGEVIVGAGGGWEFTPNPPLSEGPHPITVVVTDPGGNESEPSDPYIVIVDTTPPVKPGIGTGGIEEALDNVGSIVGDIGNGGTTDDTTPTFGGSGLNPGEKVSIIDDGNLIGEVIVGAGGSWEFTPNPPLSEGPHPITVVVTDPAGNESEPSDPYLIIVDIQAPIVPTIDSVWDDQGTATGNINPGDITDDAQPEISGQAEPGSTVIIYNNGIEIGRTTATPGGSWSYIPTPALLNGLHDLTARSQDAAGNLSGSSNSVGFELIAGGLPPAPSITGVLDDVADGLGNIMPGGSTNDTEPQVSGTAEAFSIVTLMANGVAVGTAIADQSGNWSITPSPALAAGLNNLTATATNAAGNVSAPTGEYPITVDVTPPAAATASMLTDNVGPVTGLINDGDTTDDSTPTFSGSAEPDTTLIIYNNGNEIARVSVDAQGNWSYTPASPLVDGNYSLRTVVVDAAGNRSPESAPIGFTVDTSSVAVSIEQALDNVGPVQDPLASGSVTDDSTPTLRGQATPNSTVNIYLGGNLLQSGVPVDSRGRWEYTVTPALVEGNYVFTATVVTLAGGESVPTAGFNLEIDLTSSAAPTIDAIRDDVGDVQGALVDGDTTDDTTPTLMGSGQAGDTIIIRNNGLEIDRVIIRADGGWSYTPNPPLNNGSTNVFDVIAQDPAGNQSAPSDSWTVIIDTDAPTASAVVESMGKDSGADSGDFITNDGSAGRLIQGSLTAALAADEKVQISTDDGASWLDVILNGDGTWSFIDQGSHTGNWTIQTRVVDTAGNANTSSQSVILDTTVNTPTAVIWDGTNIEVSFDGMGLEVGDKLHFLIDDTILEYSLSQTELDAGAVVMPWKPATLDSNPDKISAALVDKVGNVSTYLEFVKTDTVLLAENFNSQPATAFAVGQVIAFSNFNLEVTALGNNTASGLPGFSVNQPGWALPSNSIALQMNTGTQVKLDMTGQGFTFVSLSIGDFNNREGITAIFYGQDGSEVYSTTLTPATTGLVTNITAELPYGLSFSSVTLEAFGDPRGAFWVDDIQLGRNEYAQTGAVAPSTNQNISQEDAQYYGSDADNIFLLADVNLLSGTDVGVYGGAGVDTLSLTSTGQTLDLRSIAGKLESIEIIDITGTGNNILNLSLGDVLEQGESSLFTDDEAVQMLVKGNAGDVVNLDDLLADGTEPGDWGSQGQVTVEGVVYNVFQHSSLDAQLLVQDGVTTNLV